MNDPAPTDTHVSIPRDQLVFLLSLQDAFCGMSGVIQGTGSKSAAEEATQRYERYQAHRKANDLYERGGVTHDESDAALKAWYYPQSVEQPATTEE